MDWNQLSKFIDSLTPEQREKQAAVLIFNDGELGMLTSARKLDGHAIEKHCEDFIDGSYKKGYPYLVCGVEESAFQEV